MASNIIVKYWGGPKDGHVEYSIKKPKNDTLLYKIRNDDPDQATEYNYYVLEQVGELMYKYRYVGVVSEDDRQSE